MPGFISFKRALKNTGKSQKKILLKYLKNNVSSKYGIKYGFSNIRDISDFQERVPLSTYDDYKDYIDQISNGATDVLCKDKIFLLEPTGGSTGGSKYIPYNKTLKREFAAAISPWIFTMFADNPSLMSGRAYWSISPSMKKDHKKGQVRSGFDDDSEYLGMFGFLFSKYCQAVPKEVAEISNLEIFRTVTLLFLLKAKDLTLISIWNPTFLTLIMSGFENNISMLTDILESGKIMLDLERQLKMQLEKKLGKNAKRAEQIRKIVSDNSASGPDLYEKIWPNISIISCWTDAYASNQVPLLGKYFQNHKIIAKGLIATECITSFPMGQDKYLAINSHFFEFLREDKSFLAQELEKNLLYEVVVTTGGGLYRYRTGDIVEIQGYSDGCPLIKFAGRNNSISDLYGEKLNENHVQQVVERVFFLHKLVPQFYMVAPEMSGDNGFYCIFVSKDVEITAENARQITLQTDEGLSENFHYAYCRKLGQLGLPRIYKINENDRNPAEIVLENSVTQDKKIGGIKHTILSKKTGWSQIFSGDFIK